mgnify:CR=1 FL=1
MNINGKNEDSGIYKTIGKEASNNVHKDELWNNFVSNKIVLDLHSEIDTAYKIIKESWIESGAGKGRRMKNMSNKTTAVFIETENGDMDFQDYFVRDQCKAVVSGFGFARRGEFSVFLPVQNVIGDYQIVW